MLRVTYVVMLSLFWCSESVETQKISLTDILLDSPELFMTGTPRFEKSHLALQGQFELLYKPGSSSFPFSQLNDAFSIDQV